MAKINLLPWREELRKQKEQQFYSMLGLGAVLAAVVVFAVHLQINTMINNQNARNRYLEQEITKVEAAIKEIEELEKKKANLLARMDVIQKLQSTRSGIVHLMDELVTTLPEGMYLEAIEQKAATVTIDGVAQSNARVSSLMRNIESSGWVGNPDLKRIEEDNKRSQAGSGVKTRDTSRKFTLSLKQVTPESNKKKEGQ